MRQLDAARALADRDARRDRARVGVDHDDLAALLGADVERVAAAAAAARRAPACRDDRATAARPGCAGGTTCRMDTAGAGARATVFSAASDRRARGRASSHDSPGYRRKGDAMKWETPAFVEINMSAEIGGYQSDFGDRDPWGPVAAALTALARPITTRPTPFGANGPQ